MKYQNPIAFRNALSAKLKNHAQKNGVAIKRFQQLALFELFLSRVYEACANDILLKGGFALELRLERARTTNDIDLRGTGEIDDLVKRISVTASQERNFVSFTLTPSKAIAGDAVVYEGKRFFVQTKIGGQNYGDRFGLDLSLADALVLPPEERPGKDLFEFIGIEPLTHRIYPKEAHVAEKLHALTTKFPDGRTNTRMKDLVDIALLSRSTEFNADKLRLSIAATFAFRNTHDCPNTLPDSPQGWSVTYQNLRNEEAFEWADIDAVQIWVARFLEPLLSGVVKDTEVWRPTDQGGTWMNNA